MLKIGDYAFDEVTGHPCKVVSIRRQLFTRIITLEDLTNHANLERRRDLLAPCNLPDSILQELQKSADNKTSPQKSVLDVLEALSKYNDIHMKDTLYCRRSIRTDFSEVEMTERRDAEKAEYCRSRINYFSDAEGAEPSDAEETEPSDADKTE